ncbi:ExbD/TolR family protein [Nitrosophilus alvini]|uniref:ExbD/TolR family protein n=1 Tax=Nitrosophilus alvini TaxID=2714855 RepID=UPI00190B8D53|nr:ExbD/TolR family protein [Nitrosophilus alvini]
MYDWEEKPDLNITPLVDVMLVLLAILMVTTPAMIYEELIELPKGSKTKVVQKISTIEIRVDKNRRIYIKKEKYKFSDFADNFLLYSQKFDKNSPVYIRADKSLSYGDVMFILKTVKEAGFSKVSLITDG